MPKEEVKEIRKEAKVRERKVEAKVEEIGGTSTILGEAIKDIVIGAGKWGTKRMSAE